MFKPVIEVHHRHDLRRLVLEEIAANGPECDLNHLDISEMVDISNTFEGTNFNGDVSRWNPDSAMDMRSLFTNCPFSGDLSLWDINPRIHIDGMLGPTFSGILPMLSREPANERTAAYIKMFDGAEKYDRYLAQQPFGKLHAAFIIDMIEKPSWLTDDQFERMHNIIDLGHGLGLQHEALCSLIEGQHRNPDTHGIPESMAIDFGQ